MVNDGSATPLTPDERLLAQFLELPVDQRQVGLERLCAEHPERAAVLRRQVRRLEQAGLLAGGGQGTRPIPRHLGDFELLRPLGAGNMGVVYLARQKSLAREVALKLIRPELHLFPGAHARFAREVESVARLQHPGIVAVHAVGETEGLPWFAMEYVPGCTLAQVIGQLAGRDPETLTGTDLLRCIELLAPAAADQELHEPRWVAGSWVDTCLHLIGMVAEALHHAHGRGVLHRDIKPSNILVTRAGRACLLDFGLASSEGSARITRTGSPLGSLAYMSPEQLRGETVQAHADVYSLGVTLFELLALRLPFVASNLDVLRRMVLEGAAPRLRLFHRAVPEDVALVVQAAMAVDGVRRYPSAAALAEDIQRLRERRPILARRPGVAVRTRRWAQRNPALAASCLLAGLGLSGLLWQQHQAGVAVAAEAGRTATALATLTRLLGEFDQALAIKEPLALRVQGLVAHARGPDGEAAGRYYETWLQHAVGVTYAKLGQRGPALARLRVAERQAAACMPPLECAEIRSNLAILLRRAGQFAEAEQLHREVLALRTRELGPDHLLTVESQHNLALVLHDRASRAEAADLLEHALAVRRRGLPDTTVELAGTLVVLGEVRRELGQRDVARQLFEEALQRVAALKTANWEELASILQNLAHLELTAGQIETAALHLGQVVVLRRQLGGAELLSAQADLATAYAAGNDLARSEEQYQAALAAAEAALDADHPERATLLDGHGLLLQKLGRHREAERDLRTALQIRRKRFGPDHEDVGLSLHNLGHLYVMTGAVDQAEPLLTQALQVLTTCLGPEHAYVATATISLGKARVLLKQAEAGVALLRQGLAIRQRTMPAEDPAITSALHNLGWGLLEAGQTDAAREVMRQVLGRRRGPEDATAQATTLNNLGVAEVEAGRVAEGAGFLEEALTLRRQHLPAMHPELVITVENLLWCHYAHTGGDLARAEALAREFLAAAAVERHPAEHDRALDSLARILARRATWQEAEEVAQRLVELRRRLRPDDAKAITKAADLLARIRRREP